VKTSDYNKYCEIRKDLIAYTNSVIASDTIAVLPTAPGFAPLMGRPLKEVRSYRANVMQHICISTVAGLPEISIPIAGNKQRPLGVSMLAASGQDALLLSFGLSEFLLCRLQN